MSLIDSKAESAQVGSTPTEPAGKVIDIMAALEASISAIKNRKNPRKRKLVNYYYLLQEITN
ncbi:hypothetical protein [Sporomusa sp.]|uniref:hypothetical protein n=1 Tax=Sporomusa sp. TaxID=2078658 RepID=UPI002CCC7F47|nr:hypothetical protein [Sporomusa sp.]HWR07171.1 hypothetical protein [Sporomusa sp.]